MRGVTAILLVATVTVVAGRQDVGPDEVRARLHP
jgi:hypothetical protein